MSTDAVTGAVPVLLVGLIGADDWAQPRVGVEPLGGGGSWAPGIAVRDTRGVHLDIEDGVAETVGERRRDARVTLRPDRVPGGFSYDAVPEDIPVGSVGRSRAVPLDKKAR